MSSSFSSGVDSDASGPAGGTDSIIYKKKPRHADRHSHTLARDFSKRHKLGKVSRGPADTPHLRLGEEGRSAPHRRLLASAPTPRPRAGSAPEPGRVGRPLWLPGPRPRCLTPRPSPPRSSPQTPHHRHRASHSRPAAPGLPVHRPRPSPLLTSDPGSPISPKARRTKPAPLPSPPPPRPP